MTNEQIVRPGTVWEDCDKRAAGRTIRVDRIVDVVYGGGVVYGVVPYAVCTVLTGRGGKPVKSGRQTEIRVSRFRPTSNGYRLVGEPLFVAPAVAGGGS